MSALFFYVSQKYYNQYASKFENDKKELKISKSEGLIDRLI